MSDVMRDFWATGPEGRERAWYPEFEVREPDDEYVVRADVPGLTPDDLDVTATGNRLQISGKREHKEEQGEGEYRTRQRAYGSFSRTFGFAGHVGEARAGRCREQFSRARQSIPLEVSVKAHARVR
jgi:HSP20 family molecular chaperone IbpA